MGLAKKLSEFEKSEIKAYKASGKNITEISKLLGRSRKFVTAYISNPDFYGTKSSPERPKSVGKRTKK